MADQWISVLVIQAAVCSVAFGQRDDRGTVRPDTTYLVHGLMDDAGYSALRIAGSEFGIGYKGMSGCHPLTKPQSDSIDRVNARVDSVLIARRGVDALRELQSRVKELNDDLVLVDSALSVDARFMDVLDSAKSDPENLLGIEYEPCALGCYRALIKIGRRPGALPVVSRMEFVVDRERRLAYRR